jgi:hypothetical protein
MRPYSVDFRQKIIDVWKKEKISIRGLAQGASHLRDK